jgi:hypothetical protein
MACCDVSPIVIPGVAYSDSFHCYLDGAWCHSLFVTQPLFIVYNKGKSLLLKGDIMSIRKEDLHLLIDLVDEKDTKLVYDLIRVVIEKDLGKEIIVEADNSPLTEQEKKQINYTVKRREEENLDKVGK